MAEDCNSCCGNMTFDGASKTYKKILWIVAIINLAMFFIEIVAGFIAESTALKADALDFLGDAVTYTATLLVIGKPLKARAFVALLKGFSLGAMAIFVFGFSIYRILVSGDPDPFTMGTIGLIALSANMVSVMLLMKYRDGDSNVRSVWLCSRNDAIGNIAVMLAGAGVFVTGTVWPDVIVAFILVGLFMHSSIQITLQALSDYKKGDQRS
jgi:Co/Zn/Cd efflux system component